MAKNFTAKSAKFANPTFIRRNRIPKMYRKTATPMCVDSNDESCTGVHRLRVAWWRNGRASDFRPSGSGFDSQSGHSCVTTLGKLLTPTCLEGSPVSSLNCDGWQR